MIEYRFFKKRSTNSYKEYIGVFENKCLVIRSKLFIDNSNWDVSTQHIKIVDHKLQWKHGFDQEIISYYERIFKLIAFE